MSPTSHPFLLVVLCLFLLDISWKKKTISLDQYPHIIIMVCILLYLWLAASYTPLRCTIPSNTFDSGYRCHWSLVLWTITGLWGSQGIGARHLSMTQSFSSIIKCCIWQAYSSLNCLPLWYMCPIKYWPPAISLTLLQPHGIWWLSIQHELPWTGHQLGVTLDPWCLENMA